MIAEKYPWDGPDYVPKPGTNGCTGIPLQPIEIEHCCEVHDELYMAGGSFRERLWADWVLACCVWRTGYWLRAFVLFFGVRCGGWKFFRWRICWACVVDRVILAVLFVAAVLAMWGTFRFFERVLQ